MHWKFEKNCPIWTAQLLLETFRMGSLNRLADQCRSTSGLKGLACAPVNQRGLFWLQATDHTPACRSCAQPLPLAASPPDPGSSALSAGSSGLGMILKLSNQRSEESERLDPILQCMQLHHKKSSILQTTDDSCDSYPCVKSFPMYSQQRNCKNDIS